ncbi:hypothetical protein [Patiriisocius sp. Uisw_017]|jgi:hypothetical protein|uniref:hypothetical protein n=1 Tax=Patiriisocius sp. Uisw_017 TaxID=3230968 RepID=UPI0039EBB861
MFKRIINHKGFWKSVLVMSLIALLVFNILYWTITGFQASYWHLTVRKIIGMTAAALVYGLIITYGKFWTRFANQDHRKNDL